jgi:hypothetical protein
MTNFIIGIDQYNQHYDDLGKYPRQELLNRLGYKNARKMYVDKKDGTIKHIGYVVGSHWVTLYNLTPWEKEVLAIIKYWSIRQ